MVTLQRVRYISCIILLALWTGVESTYQTWQVDQSSPVHTTTTCTGQTLALNCPANTIIRLRTMKMSVSSSCPNHYCRGWMCSARCSVSSALQQRLADSCSGRQECRLSITTNDMSRGSTNAIHYNSLEVGHDCEPATTIRTPMCSNVNLNTTLAVNLTSNNYPSASTQVHNCTCRITPPDNSIVLLEAVDLSMGGSLHYYSRRRVLCRYLAKMTINETRVIYHHRQRYLQRSTYHAACTNLTNYMTQFYDAQQLTIEYDSIMNSNSRFWIKLSAFKLVSDSHDSHDDDDDDDHHDRDDDDDDDDDDDHHRHRRGGSHHHGGTNMVKRRTWLSVNCQDNHVVNGGPWTETWTSTTQPPIPEIVTTRRPVPTQAPTRRPMPTTAPTRRPMPTTAPTRKPMSTVPPTRRPMSTVPPTRRPMSTVPSTRRPMPTTAPTRKPMSTESTRRPMSTDTPSTLTTSVPTKVTPQAPKFLPLPPEDLGLPTSPDAKAGGNQKQTDMDKKEYEKVQRPGMKHDHVLILIGVLSAAFLVIAIVGTFLFCRYCRPLPTASTIAFNKAFDNAIYQNTMNESQKPAKEKEAFAYDNVVYAVPSEEKVKL